MCGLPGGPPGKLGGKCSQTVGRRTSPSGWQLCCLGWSVAAAVHPIGTQNTRRLSASFNCYNASTQGSTPEPGPGATEPAVEGQVTTPPPLPRSQSRAALPHLTPLHRLINHSGPRRSHLPHPPFLPSLSPQQSSPSTKRLVYVNC